MNPFEDDSYDTEALITNLFSEARRYRLAWLSARRRAQILDIAYEADYDEFTSLWNAVSEEEKTRVMQEEFDKIPKVWVRYNEETDEFERVEPPYTTLELPLEY